MDMDYGKVLHKFQKVKSILQIKLIKINKLIQGNIEWIKKKVSEFINGKLKDIYIKGNLKMILEMDTDK